MIHEKCKQLLYQNTFVEEYQLKHHRNLNYDGLDYVHNPIPEIPYGSLFSNGKIAVTKNNRFSFVPAHTHKFIEMNYVFSGKSHQFLNNNDITSTEGQLLIIDRGIVQKINYSNNDDLIVNILIKDIHELSTLIGELPIKNTELYKFLEHCTLPGLLGHSNYLICDLNLNPVAKSLIDTIIYKGMETKYNYSIELIMVAFINELSTCITKNVSDFSIDEQNIEEIIQYINNHYATITLDKLSCHFNYNPNYLSNKIKLKTGKSFKELIELRRIDTAQNLIIKTDLSLTEINQLIGYQNVTSLYRLFKKYLDCSPAEFRQKVRS